MQVIQNRNELPKLFQEHYLTGYGCEVGVFRGIYTAEVFKHWNGTTYLVDSWCVPGVDMEQAYKEMEERLVGQKKIIMKMDSLEAAKQIPDGLLDWVYIDADHTYRSCKKDMQAWIPKVRGGGVVAGHDYTDGFLWGGFYGVKSAVDEYAKKTSIEINVTLDPDDFEGVPLPSWWFIKESK